MHGHLRFVLVPLLACVAGCDTTRTIGYDTTAVRASAEPRLNVTLEVALFRDERRRNPQNAALFHGDREVDVNDTSHCVNSEEHYESQRVAAQVSAVIAGHLRRRGVFANVRTRPGGGHYRLSGVIAALYGEQETSSEAQTGMAFGLVGALATAGATTKGRVIIRFTDLRIHEPAGRQVAVLQDVHIDYRGDLQADAYCWAIYENVNEKLREAVGHLAIQVERAIRYDQQRRSGTAPVAIQSRERADEGSRR